MYASRLALTSQTLTAQDECDITCQLENCIENEGCDDPEACNYNTPGPLDGECCRYIVNSCFDSSMSIVNRTYNIYCYCI